MPPSLLSAVGGALTTTGLVTISIVPAILVAMNYMRYNVYDPESKIADVQQVYNEMGKFLHGHKTQNLSSALDTISKIEKKPNKTNRRISCS